MKIDAKIYFLIIFSSLFMFSLAAFSEEHVVAVVGNQKITLDEFNKRYSEVKSQTVNPPAKELFLEDLIRYKIGLQEAEKKNLKDDPVVSERIKQEIYKGLIERELGKSVEAIRINEEEMLAYYKKNPEIRTSHILIEIKPGATAEEKALGKKRAQEIYADVKKSKKSFEELVNLYSDDSATKPLGGDIGWQSHITLVPTYYAAADALKVGEISPIVESEFGFHIIKLTGRNTYEKANKRQIRAALFDDKRKQLFDKYFSKLRSSYKVQVNKSLLK